MIAKASTTCTYSLDPITLSPGNSTKTLNYRNTSRACAQPPSQFLKREPVDTYNHYPVSIRIHPRETMLRPRLRTTNRHTLLLQIVKEQPMHQPKLATSSPVKNQSQISPLSDFLGYGIFPHRPSLHPRHTTELVEVNGIEPMTSCLQSTRSPN